MSVGTSDQSVSAGTYQCPYKLCIVGGGPSGCSIIIRAIRTGFIDELCGFVQPPDSPPSTPTTSSSQNSSGITPTQAGVCIIEKGGMSRFGGGRLQDYQINSNTWANKFVTNVLNDKQDVTPVESVQGTLLEKLKDNPNSITVEAYGNKNGPLNVVGSFLCDAGAIVREQLERYPQSSKCHTDTTVQCISRIQDKTFTGWRVVAIDKDLIVSEIYSTNLALCTGGLQPAPTFPNPLHTAKIMTSDHVCTEKGVNELRSRFAKAGRCKVTIVGGSHSAFSAAWMCLNKIASNTPSTSTTVTTAAPATAQTSSTISAPNSPAKQSRFGPAGVVGTPNKNSSSIGDKLSASLSRDTSQPTNSSSGSSSSGGLHFAQNSIVMLHRSAIDVFYATKAEADADSYPVEPSQIGKITGQIHPFGGLRGDAKELWRAVRTMREQRVRLMQIKHPVATVQKGATAANGVNNLNGTVVKQNLVDTLFDESVVIIWACGYYSNTVPIYDTNGKLIPLRLFRGQVEVDDNANILAEESYTFATEKVKSTSNSTSTSTSIPNVALKTPKRKSRSESFKEEVSNAALALAVDTATEISPNSSSRGSESAYVVENDASVSEKQDSTSMSDSSRTSPVEEVVGTATAATELAPATTTVISEKAVKPGKAVPTSPNGKGSKVPPFPLSSSAAAAGVKAVSNGKKSDVPIANRTHAVPNLMGNGLGFGFKAVLENGELDGSSGRADGVAVYLKRGATLILAKVLGNKVYGGNGTIKSWEERNKEIRRQQALKLAAEKETAATATATGAILVAAGTASTATVATVAAVPLSKTGNGNSKVIGELINTLNSACRQESHDAAAATMVAARVSSVARTPSRPHTVSTTNGLSRQVGVPSPSANVYSQSSQASRSTTPGSNNRIVQSAVAVKSSATTNPAVASKVLPKALSRGSSSSGSNGGGSSWTGSNNGPPKPVPLPPPLNLDPGIASSVDRLSKPKAIPASVVNEVKAKPHIVARSTAVNAGGLSDQTINTNGHSNSICGSTATPRRGDGAPRGKTKAAPAVTATSPSKVSSLSSAALRASPGMNHRIHTISPTQNDADALGEPPTSLRPISPPRSGNIESLSGSLLHEPAVSNHARNTVGSGSSSGSGVGSLPPPTLLTRSNSLSASGASQQSLSAAGEMSNSRKMLSASFTAPLNTVAASNGAVRGFVLQSSPSKQQTALTAGVKSLRLSASTLPPKVVHLELPDIKSKVNSSKSAAPIQRLKQVQHEQNASSLCIRGTILSPISGSGSLSIPDRTTNVRTKHCLQSSQERQERQERQDSVGGKTNIAVDIAEVIRNESKDCSLSEFSDIVIVKSKLSK